MTAKKIIHQIHVDILSYNLINMGDKCFLVVDNDKVMPGDRVRIHEQTEKKKQTGRCLMCIVDCVDKDGKGITKGWCVINLRSTQYEIELN